MDGDYVTSADDCASNQTKSLRSNEINSNGGSSSVAMQPQSNESTSSFSVIKSACAGNSQMSPSSRSCVGTSVTNGDRRLSRATLDGNMEDIPAETMSMVSKTSRSSRFSRRFSLRKSKAWLSSKLQKHQRKNELSATFNLLNQENKGVLVNVNTATEEELMTVKGITRMMAHSIVEYRNAIGGFKQLQDLALVSGIGATRLSTLCKDLTLGDIVTDDSLNDADEVPSTPPSIASAPSPQSQSYYSTPVRGASFSLVPIKKVNINTASIFELMTVPCVNQEIAASIYHHREKKGKFKSVEDLNKVKGLNLKVTRQLLPYLTVSGASLDASQPSSSTPSKQTNSGQENSNYLRVKNGSFKSQCHRRTLSAPPQNNTNERYTPVDFIEEENLNKEPVLPHQPNTDTTSSRPASSHRLSCDFSSDVYDLLSLRSERPEVHNLFENSHNERSAIRIATWNLSKLTADKLSNPGVLEVICRTVLERGFTILGVQDILGAELLQIICNELNTGSLRRVREWPGKRGTWAYIQSSQPVSSYSLFRNKKTCPEYSGFLFNSRFVQLIEHSIVDCDALMMFTSKPYIAKFKASNLLFVAVNMHVKLQSGMFMSDSYIHSLLDLEETFQSAQDISFCEDESLDSLKKSKNLQNGLIKEGREEDGRRHHLSCSSDCEAVQEEVATVVNAFKKNITEEDSNRVVLLGAISAASLGGTDLSDMQCVLPPDTITTLTATPSVADTIYISDGLSSAFTDEWSVVKEGLSHLAIPKGWGWGGLATTHCPVYADLYTDTEL